MTYKQRKHLTNQEVKSMKILKAAGVTTSVIAAQFDCSRITVHNHTKDTPSPLYEPKVSAEIVALIRSMREAGHSLDDICERTGVTVKTARKYSKGIPVPGMTVRLAEVQHEADKKYRAVMDGMSRNVPAKVIARETGMALNTVYNYKYRIIRDEQERQRGL